MVEDISIKIESKEAENTPIQKLQKLVDDRYENSQRFKDDPDGLKLYIEHYKAVTQKAVEIGEEEGLKRGQIAALEVIGSLHDLTKADAVPDGYHPAYWVVAHGRDAANEIRENWQTNQTIKDAIQYVLDSDEDNIYVDEEAVVHQIATAIETHMGPRPGFMQNLADKVVNPTLPKDQKIKFELPPEGDRVSEVFITADLESLAGISGVEKVMGDRLNEDKNPHWVKEDRENAKKFSRDEVEFTQEEMALLSAFKSAIEARNMISIYPDLVSHIDKSIKQVKSHTFEIGDKKVNMQDVLNKVDEYQKSLAREIVNKKGGLDIMAEDKVSEKGFDRFFKEMRGWDEMKPKA